MGAETAQALGCNLRVDCSLFDRKDHGEVVPYRPEALGRLPLAVAERPEGACARQTHRDWLRSSFVTADQSTIITDLVLCSHRHGFAGPNEINFNEMCPGRENIQAFAFIQMSATP